MVNYCRSSKSLVGKTTVVTGANAGLGYETALEFAKRGGRVILACRNPERGNAAREKIVEATANENVIFKALDLSSFDSVRKFAKDLSETEERLDILVNNAGAMHAEQTTTDGVQLAMQVNYFSPFLLTHLLLDTLNEYSGDWKMYFKTKLCQIYYTIELAKRLEGSGVTVYSLNPSAVHTEFQASMPVLNWFAGKLFLSSEQGAQTQIYCSLEDGIEQYNGRHFENCRPVSTYCNARDEKKAKQLWEISEKTVGITS